MAQIPFLAPAREELLLAADHYEDASPGLGSDFVEEVERAVHRIVRFPDHGSPHLAGTRRVVLQRFPFNVVYVRDSEDLLIVAVAHHKRTPGYWRERLGR